MSGGHNLTYARNYSRTLLQMGYRVLGLAPDPPAVVSWLEERCPDALDRVRFVPFRDEMVTSPIWRIRKLYIPLKRWRKAGKAIRIAANETGFVPDFVFFNWLDDYLLGACGVVGAILPVVFPYRWSGMYFHPWHLRMVDDDRRAESAASKYVMKARNCVSVAVLDEGIKEALASQTGKKVTVFPDGTDESLPEKTGSLVRRVLTQAGERKIIALMGSMARRKGVPMLLDVAERCRDRPWFFMFAGALSEGGRRTFDEEELRRMDRAIAGEVPNVFFHSERIDDEEQFNALAAASDVLFAVYARFAHSSGIVTKAAVLEKPLIVARGYCMEERVRRYRLGIPVAENSADEVIDALDRILGADAWYMPGGAPDFDGCRREHSTARLKHAFEEVLSYDVN